MKKSIENYVSWDEWFANRRRKEGEKRIYLSDDELADSISIFGHIGCNYIHQKVADAMSDPLDWDTQSDVISCMARYCNADWGDGTKKQAKLNDEIAAGMAKGDIRATYRIHKGTLRIVTSADRRMTKIMWLSTDRKENSL